ncbi:SH3 domain-containing protein [Thermocrinis sp.]|uniref:SH3 domain-containing protein n=1 Tax=Thermocrinis sp. TaxID=2024383 RepID=UPI002FDDE55F
MTFIALLLLISFVFSLERETTTKQALELIPQMADLRSFPTHIEREKLKAWILEDAYPNGKLYLNEVPLKDKLLEKLYKNANVEEIPEKVDVAYGLTLRRTDLKLLPTEAVVHKGNPEIDYNQYSALDPFTPLVVMYQSKDGEWFFIQSTFLRGWVRKKDVELISRERFLKLFELPFLVVIKPELRVEDLTYSMGAKIPYVGSKKEEYLVLTPKGEIRRVSKDGLIEGFWNFSEDRAKYLLESLLGLPYQWGGYYDCSALVRAFFGVFGIEMPRNSYQQALVGDEVKVDFKSYEEFKQLLKELPPYRTLLYMKGHVMIFGGFEGEDVVIYHAVYSIKKDDGQKIYPKAVVKNLLERDALKNLHRRIIAIRVLK